MNAATGMFDTCLQDFRQIESALPGSGAPWLRAQRVAALETFRETGFPTLRHEDWKYTDARPIVQRRFRLAAAHALPDAAALRPYTLAGHQLVFVDGRFAASLSTPAPLPAGVEVMSLAQALARVPERLEPWLGRYASPGQNGFAALNAAFLQDGAFIHLARGTALEAPLHLLFVASGAADTLAYVRNLIVAEADSAASVIESYAPLSDATGFTNSVTEIVLEQGAQVEHYRLGREGEAAYHIGSTHVQLARDSRYTSHSIAFGGRIVRHELYATLEGEGAECTLNGLTVTHGRQHVDNHTRIDHRQPRGTSREWYKGVLDDQSRAVFSGRIVVHPQAQHTDAEQANHNLLLSPDAEADSRPQLEIYADDVKCAHGATVGSLDADALFYLRTRGLDMAHARSLMVYAFASDVLARMSLAPLRAQLEQQLAGRLALPRIREEPR
jgi:Fe-S cluster assembly protein SufD